MLLLLIYLCISSAAQSHPDDKYISGNNTNQPEAIQFLHENDAESRVNCIKIAKANWNYDSNITEFNKQKMLEMADEGAKFSKKTWEKATSFDWKVFKGVNNMTYAWFKSLSVLGDAILPDEKYHQLQKLVADMTETYSTSGICPSNNSCVKKLQLEPDLANILTISRNYDLLKYVWEEWRNVTGKAVKTQYNQYVDLRNEAARLNGFKDAGELWRDIYGSPDFDCQVELLLHKLQPFYEQLHAYVRRKLMAVYPNKIKPDGPIPAHLLGNMWAQTWDNIRELVLPYPNESAVDVTPEMLKKNMTALQMFQMSEEFFKSLGLKPMTPEFWEHSIMEKPEDRQIICHASAWDMCDGKDFRIKMCTQVNMNDFVIVHHEMGHVQYYLQYAHLPGVFRTGANPGFHEAVGDVLALSVSTPKHLNQIGLLGKPSESYEAQINYLLSMALSKMAFLPYGYTLDLWRWGVFSNEIPKEQMNTKFWEMRLKYQGLCPPSKRTENDLDPAAKYHVIADVPYIRYFVSYIIQFQFHKALCKEAGHTGPLHECDIYRNRNAGKLFSEVLNKGSSVSWEEAMHILTQGETDEMDVSGILEYFDPLIKWLEQQNKDEFIGWKSDDPTICP